MERSLIVSPGEEMVSQVLIGGSYRRVWAEVSVVAVDSVAVSYNKPTNRTGAIYPSPLFFG